MSASGAKCVMQVCLCVLFHCLRVWLKFMETATELCVCVLAAEKSRGGEDTRRIVGSRNGVQIKR